jgi:hypothetical protein
MVKNVSSWCGHVTITYFSNVLMNLAATSFLYNLCQSGLNNLQWYIYVNKDFTYRDTSVPVWKNTLKFCASATPFHIHKFWILLIFNFVKTYIIIINK